MRKIFVVLMFAALVLSCANKATGERKSQSVNTLINSKTKVKGSPVEEILNLGFEWGETYEKTKTRLPTLIELNDNPSSHYKCGYLKTNVFLRDGTTQIEVVYAYGKYSAELESVLHKISFKNKKTSDAYYTIFYNHYYNILKTTTDAEIIEKPSPRSFAGAVTLYWNDGEHTYATMVYNEDRYELSISWYSPYAQPWNTQQ